MRKVSEEKDSLDFEDRRSSSDCVSAEVTSTYKSSLFLRS